MTSIWHLNVRNSNVLYIGDVKGTSADDQIIWLYESLWCFKTVKLDLTAIAVQPPCPHPTPLAVPLPPSAPERLPVQPWHNAPSRSLDHPLISVVASAGVTLAAATLIYYDWYTYSTHTVPLIPYVLIQTHHNQSSTLAHTNSHKSLQVCVVILCGWTGGVLK